MGHIAIHPDGFFIVRKIAHICCSLVATNNQYPKQNQTAMRNFSYEEGELTISIPTTDPKAMREQLMHGLNRAMRNYIVSKDDRDEQLALVQLMESLLPPEEVDN